MSVMMPPDYAAGLPTAPGGGDPTQAGGDAGPRDALNQGPIPSQGGIADLLAALGGGGAGGDGGGGDTSANQGDMTAVDHIQQAMKHLMMAMTLDSDEQNNLGLTKGMGALQGILAGDQKKKQQMSQLSGQ